MTGVLVACAAMLAATLLGRSVLFTARVRMLSREGLWGASFAVGYVIIGTLLLAAGLLGLFSPLPVLLLTGVAGAAGLGGLTRTNRAPLPPWAIVRMARRHPVILGCLGVVTVLVLPPVAARALLPATEGDALCYHVALPAQFLRFGCITFLPWTDQSLFPLLADIWFAVPLSSGTATGVRLISFGVFLAFLAATVELSLVAGGLACAALAAILTLASPIVTNHASVCFSDLPVAMLGAWSAVFAARLTAQRRHPGALGLFCLFLGGAAACKLTGLAWAFCLGSALLLASISARAGSLSRNHDTARPCSASKTEGGVRIPPSGRLTEWASGAWTRVRGRQAVSRGTYRPGSLVATFVPLAIGLLVAAPWYARAWIHAGNPFHPLLADVWPGAAPVYDWRPPKSPPAGRTPLPLLSLPWQVTLEPERFGGRGHQWGVAFLAFLPGLFVCPPRQLRVPLLACAAYALFWALTRQNLRFLLPAMPLLAVSAARLIETARLFAPRHALLALVAVLCLHTLAGTVAAWRRCPPLQSLALTRKATQEFLEAHEPTYLLAERIRNAVSMPPVILTPEHRVFYLPGTVIREDALRRWLGYTVRGPEFLSLCRYLGVTHILLVTSNNPAVAVYDRSLAERIKACEDELRVLLTHRFKGPDGDDRLYVLLEVAPGEARLPDPARCDIVRARALAAQLRACRESTPDRRAAP